MAKFYGKIGFAISAETEPGIWTDGITERNYRGDVLRNIRRLQSGDKVIDDFNITNEFSILSDPFAMENLQYMKYLEYLNVKWKITSIDIQYPRMILTVGGVYNE